MRWAVANEEENKKDRPSTRELAHQPIRPCEGRSKEVRGSARESTYTAWALLLEGASLLIVLILFLD
jgi:hypothetical protein